VLIGSVVQRISISDFGSDDRGSNPFGVTFFLTSPRDEKFIPLISGKSLRGQYTGLFKFILGKSFFFYAKTPYQQYKVA
jgi:hypothetical protein